MTTFISMAQTNLSQPGPLSGTWTLKAAQVILPDGKLVTDLAYGDSAKGILMIDADGRYSLQIIQPTRTGTILCKPGSTGCPEMNCIMKYRHLQEPEPKRFPFGNGRNQILQLMYTSSKQICTRLNCIPRRLPWLKLIMQKCNNLQGTLIHFPLYLIHITEVDQGNRIRWPSPHKQDSQM